MSSYLLMIDDITKKCLVQKISKKINLMCIEMNGIFSVYICSNKKKVVLFQIKKIRDFQFNWKISQLQLIKCLIHSIIRKRNNSYSDEIKKNNKN